MTNVLEAYVKKYYLTGKNFCKDFNITEATLVRWKKITPEFILKIISLTERCSVLNKDLEYEKNYSRQLELKILQKE